MQLKRLFSQFVTHTNIRQHILIPTLLSLFSIIAIAIITMYWLENSRLHKQLARQVENTKLFFEHQKRVESTLLRGLIISVDQDQRIQKAWLKRDRNKLLQLSTPLFKDLLNHYRVTHFYFIDLEKRCFLRVHNPPRRNDIINRKTLALAIETGSTGSGIELGPLGTFTLRVVQPWHINGRLAGYIELGMEIDHLLPEIKRALNIDIFLLINKDFLKRKDWEVDIKFLGKNHQWDRMENHVLIDSSIEQNPELETLAYENHITEYDNKNTLTLHTLNLNDSIYSTAFLPLIDASDRNVGKFVIVQNITQEHAALNRFLALLVIISIIIAAFLLAFFYLYAGRIENLIHESNRRLAQESLEREAALLRAKNAADETNNIKNQFMYNVSHELRTPLNGVLGALQVLNDTPLSSDQEEYINIAIQSGNTLIELVNKILDFKQIDSRSDLLEKINFNVATTIRDTVRNFSPRAQDKKLKLNCFIDTEVSEWVKGDPGRLIQILNNLLDNAIKFSEKGEITVTLNTEPEPDDTTIIIIKISDNGIGIPAELQENIFNAFVQLDSSTTRKYSGTGLGLAVTKTLVESMGGKLNVTSTPGVGSIFSVKIPVLTVKKDEN